MEDTIHNIAVISFPRTTSKSLAKYYGTLYNKPVAEGSLHQPLYLGSDCYDPGLIFEETHILHGHWHSLHNLSEQALDHLRNKYKIVTSYRPEQQVRDSLERITGKDLFDDTMAATIPVRNQWFIWKQFVIDGDDITEVDSMPEGYC